MGKCVPELILASYVSTCCQVECDNEHSLHMWKRHPCTSTVSRHLTDLRERFKTRHDLRGILQSKRYGVFFNPAEVYWIAAISKYFKTGCITFRSSAKLATSSVFQNEVLRRIFHLKEKVTGDWEKSIMNEKSIMRVSKYVLSTKITV
jgi:hypothetical protein